MSTVLTTITLVFKCHSGLFMPHVHGIPEIVFGKLAEMVTGSQWGHDPVLHPVLLKLLLPARLSSLFLSGHRGPGHAPVA